MSHGSYRMDEWTLPLRGVKYGANLDVDGNRSFEICDSKNRTAFFIRINGREYGAADSLEKEILPRILNSFNTSNPPTPQPQTQAQMQPQTQPQVTAKKFFGRR